MAVIFVQLTPENVHVSFKEGASLTVEPEPPKSTKYWSSASYANSASNRADGLLVVGASDHRPFDPMTHVEPVVEPFALVAPPNRTPT